MKAAKKEKKAKKKMEEERQKQRKLASEVEKEFDPDADISDMSFKQQLAWKKQKIDYDKKHGLDLARGLTGKSTEPVDMAGFHPHTNLATLSEEQLKKWKKQNIQYKIELRDNPQIKAQYADRESQNSAKPTLNDIVASRKQALNTNLYKSQNSALSDNIEESQFET